MKQKLLSLLFFLFGMMCFTHAQAPHLFEHTYPEVMEEHPQIRTLMNKVSIDSLEATIRHLQDYPTRQWNSQKVYEVQDWLYATYRDYGFDSVYLHDFPVHYHDSLFETSDNVVALLKGKRYPNEFVVCGAHYDSYNNSPGNPDSLQAPGADDNASGVSGVLEIARILRTCSFERSVVFCNFAAEEIGLVGSAAYAKDCADQLLDIVGYFNLDMIGYLEEGSDIHVNLLYTGQDSLLAKYVYDFSRTYYPDMRIWQAWLSQGDSDYSSFNRNGYPAVHTFEDTHHSSPFIHTPNDVLGLSVNNMEQAKRFTELNLGLVANLAGLVSDGVEEEVKANLQVFPNPASDAITIAGISVRQVDVYDLLGQPIFSRSFHSENSVTLPVKDYNSGVYIIQIITSEGVLVTTKFILL